MVFVSRDSGRTVTKLIFYLTNTERNVQIEHLKVAFDLKRKKQKIRVRLTSNFC